MSMSPRANGVGSDTYIPHEERAEHVGDEFSETIAAFRNTLWRATGLAYLAHYSSDVFDFSIDLLGDPPRSADALPGTTRRDQLQRLGRALSFAVSGLDRDLQEVRTGGLIRTVLHTEQGAGFCNSVVLGEHMVGFLVDCELSHELEDFRNHIDHMQAADIAMGELATELRERISLPSANPGGWASANLATPMPATNPSGSFVTVFADVDERTDQLKEACKRAVRPVDLHFVAYCKHGEVMFTADQLADRALAPFFTQITVAARRKFYLNFSRELCTLVGRLGRSTSGVLRGRLQRLVLDVEQGAIYYYRLNAGGYLVGVTIDQSRVSHADDQMSVLALECCGILARESRAG